MSGPDFTVGEQLIAGYRDRGSGAQNSNGRATVTSGTELNLLWRITCVSCDVSLASTHEL